MFTTKTTKTAKTAHILEAALHYLDLRLTPIPLKPNSKEPAISWSEYQHRLPTHEEMEGWFGGREKDNIGLVCGRTSDLIVLDVDDPEKFRVALEEMGAKLPDTPIVKTPRGFHLYFRYPANRVVRRHERLGDWGAELRGEGCYVVAPPSIVNGHQYRWAKRRGKRMVLGEVGLAECPDWLLDAFGVPYASDIPQAQPISQPSQSIPQPLQSGVSLSVEQRALLKTILSPHWLEGFRHDLALGVAGLLAKNSIAMEDALSLLREIAEAAKDNEWKDRERALRDSFERLWRGEQVVGYKRLEEILGEETARVVASIVQSTSLPSKGHETQTPVKLLTAREWSDKLSSTLQGQWIIEGLLQEGWLVAINARPKTGKSIFAANIAKALANGEPFLNRPTVPCAVVYIELERPLETRNRLQALGVLDNPNIFVPDGRVGADMIDILRSLIQEAKRRTNRPVVVLIDTFADFIKSALRQRKATINDYDTIAEILQSLRDLALEEGCAFIFVHHTRKAQAEEPSEVDVLGSTAIAGKFDVLIHLQPDKTDAGVLCAIAEGNAIAKTVLHFAIEADFKLTPCEPPAKTKEEQTAREIKRLLERYPNGLSRAEIVRYLCDLGLAVTPDGAQSLFRRAITLVGAEARRDGKHVLYTLPTPRLIEPDSGHDGQDIEFDQCDHCSQKAKQNKAENNGHDNGHVTDRCDHCSDETMVKMVNMVNDTLTNVTIMTNLREDIGQTTENRDHYHDHYENPNKTRRFGEHWSQWSNTNMVTNDQSVQDDQSPEVLDLEAFEANFVGTEADFVGTEALLAELEDLPDQPDLPLSPSDSPTSLPDNPPVGLPDWHFNLFAADIPILPDLVVTEVPDNKQRHVSKDNEGRKINPTSIAQETICNNAQETVREKTPETEVLVEMANKVNKANEVKDTVTSTETIKEIAEIEVIEVTDTEEFFGETLAETFAETFGETCIPTEEWLELLEEPESPPKSPPNSPSERSIKRSSEKLPKIPHQKPDNIACLCGSSLRLVGQNLGQNYRYYRYYRCSNCQNPRPAFCRKCGKVLRVNERGYATCIDCKTPHNWDTKRRLWLSAEDPF